MQLASSPPYFGEEAFCTVVLPPALPPPPGFSFPFPLGNIGLTHFLASWGWICIIPPAQRDAGTLGERVTRQGGRANYAPRNHRDSGRGKNNPALIFITGNIPLFWGFYSPFPFSLFPGSFPQSESWVFHRASQDFPNSLLFLGGFPHFPPILSRSWTFAAAPTPSRRSPMQEVTDGLRQAGVEMLGLRS